ncbi:hypothetical protein GOODEAATRI_028950 [Goodea atripinnis]|uniref:Uncharacterized protein n=1 Tax=Goodea atripinnis TaxID=208336 RepID=A0ABV0N556_9TELE
MHHYSRAFERSTASGKTCPLHPSVRSRRTITLSRSVYWAYLISAPLLLVGSGSSLSAAAAHLVMSSLGFLRQLLEQVFAGT